MVTDRVGPTITTLKAEVDYLDGEVKKLLVLLADARTESMKLRAALREIAGLGVVCASDIAVVALRDARAALEGERSKCYPVQFSDQIVCGKCGLTWDVNDPAPPRCKEGRT